MKFLSLLPHQSKTFKALVEALRSDLSSIQNAILEHTSATRSAAEAAEKNQKEISLRIAELRIPEAEKTAANSYRQKTYQQQVILNFLTAATALGAFIYAGIAACQLNQMKIATRASTQAAEAAANAVILQQSSSQIDQRAWVAVSNVEFMRYNDSFHANIVFVNTGKTPAKDFTIRVAGEPVPKGESPTSEEALQPGHGVIAPNGAFHSPLSANGYYDAKRNDLVIHGRIDYVDVFGENHWTKFCYLLIPKTGATGAGFSRDPLRRSPVRQ